MGFNRALKFNYRIGRRNKIEVYTRTNFKNGRCEVNYRRNWRRIAILTTIIDVKDKIWRRFLYLYKLTFITLNSVFGIFIKNKNIKFFLTIDTEAKFIDKVAVDIDSYEKDIYESCIKIADLANEYDIKVISVENNFPKQQGFKDFFMNKKLWEASSNLKKNSNLSLIRI